MESKVSLSPFGDDHRSLNQTGTPSALRAFTSSRLSLTRGRSRRDSISTSSCSSTPTRSSIDSNTSPSCVTRTVSPDQCALYRFIVWVAVRRNSCRNMTPAERLECPLLRCRKRFPSHEDMLRHLYTCEHLSSGEYWCYDCGKAEKFTEGKCKRCPGHPGKRRRIMSFAKSFFSSLGHKSRNQGVTDLDMDFAVASYDAISILVQPQQVELSSATEILEIDSTEVPLPLPTTSFASTNAFDNMPPNLFGPLSTAPEQTLSVMPDLNFEWGLQSDLDMTDLTKGDRPSLSVHTHGLSQYHKQQKHQKPTTHTKKLSPSNSLRSNVSTDTSASYMVSPASNYSAAWTNADTCLTSPTSDCASSAGYLSRGCSNASHYSNASRCSNNPDLRVHSFISELPAEDIMPDLSQALPDDLDCDQRLLSVAASNAAGPIMDEDSIKQVEDTQPQVEATEILKPAYLVDADSLVRSVWDALKAHVSSSLEKLQPLSHNSLVAELRSLSSQRISDIGLETLRAILEGRQPISAIDTLCFVHVVYSLSLVIHEADAHNRSKQLYTQAYLYGQSFEPGDRETYLEVASALWQPSDLPIAEFNDLLDHCIGYVSGSVSLKGKQRHLLSTSSRHDIFVDLAHFFLDELEYTIKGTASCIVLGSKIWDLYFHDDSTPIVPAFVEVVKSFSDMLCQKRLQSSSFISKIGHFQKRVGNGSIRTVRRAELELLQAGKGCMSLQDYFENYVPQVREQFLAACEQKIPGFRPRRVYHERCIELMQRIIQTICEKEAITYGTKYSSDVGGDRDLDEFIRTLTNDLETTTSGVFPDDFTFKESFPAVQVSMDFADPTVPMYDGSQEQEMNNLQPLPTPENCTTSMSPVTARATRPDAGSKVEVHANDCCEICGYRPKGDPQWFKGSMAKHKKLQHSTAPPKIYHCPYPGCTSQYKNRPDNLKQHQQDKGHFVGGETERRTSKRKRRGINPA